MTLLHGQREALKVFAPEGGPCHVVYRDVGAGKEEAAGSLWG